MTVGWTTSRSTASRSRESSLSLGSRVSRLTLSVRDGVLSTPMLGLDGGGDGDGECTCLVETLELVPDVVGDVALEAVLDLCSVGGSLGGGFFLGLFLGGLVGGTSLSDALDALDDGRDVGLVSDILDYGRDPGLDPGLERTLGGRDALLCMDADLDLAGELALDTVGVITVVEVITVLRSCSLYEGH